MFCRNCGAKVADTDLFCQTCGRETFGPTPTHRPHHQSEPRKGNKKGIGTIILMIVVGGIALLILLAGIGSIMQDHERAEFDKLTPEQQHTETLKNCADLLRSWEFKTYSELSVTERRMKAACTQQLARPDAQVFR